MRNQMHQRELLEFRTPQHPCMGTNNWGGASPLLARDIPKESLEQRYLRLTSIRTRDEIFPTEDDVFSYYLPQSNQSQQHDCTCTPPVVAPPAPSSGHHRSKVRFLLKFLAKPSKDKTVNLGGSDHQKKRRWFPKWDARNRWPQGWC